MTKRPTGSWPLSSTHGIRRTCAGALLAVLILATTTSCRAFTKEAADEEVYSILDQGRDCVPEIAGGLDVDAADRVSRAARCSETYTLTLTDALALAAAASRDYLSEREDVYLTALTLTGERAEYRPLFGLGGTGEVLGTGSDASSNGTRFRGNVDGDASKAFETGGGIVFGLLSNFLKNLTTGDPFSVAQTILSADILLPLARGSGWVARENLTQAERNALYSMRDFALFQQEFTVRIASRYFRLLQLRDTWKNEERTYESLTRLLERQTALGAEGAGRIPDFEVDQTRQDVLRADERRLLARIAYSSSTDDFKLLLGIPTLVTVEVPEDELERLRAEGLRIPSLRQADAVPLALERRLDLANAVDQEQDAWRKVLVAKNGLGPQVDLRLGGALRTLETHPLDLTDTQVEGLIGLDLDLPLNRWNERNAYRRSLILAARARRSRQGLEDQVVLDVREAYRRLERGGRSYEIQRDGVRLANRRVESTALLLEAGKASTRDRLEAQDALVRAQNALTLALVDYTVARLELERDVGTLQVRANATWQALESTDPVDATGTSEPAGASSPAPFYPAPPPPAPATPLQTQTSCDLGMPPACRPYMPPTCRPYTLPACRPHSPPARQPHTPPAGTAGP